MEEPQSHGWAATAAGTDYFLYGHGTMTGLGPCDGEIPESIEDSGAFVGHGAFM
jgi:hypothetical protein